MSLSAFIDDGYTREGTIAEAPRQWPAASISYRPMVASEYAEFSVKTKNLDNAAWHKAIAEILEKKLVAWDIKSAAGDSVEIKRENLLRLMPGFLLRVWQIVSGDTPDDGTDEKNWPTG